MSFTLTQKKQAYKNLPAEVQYFIVSNENTELITNYLITSGLTEEQSALADSEILYTMCGLQSLSEAINNISKLSGKSVNDLSQLKSNLENSIFKKIPNDKNPGTPESNKNKVIEISKKYNLSQSQTDKLLNILTPIIVAQKKPDGLMNTIVNNLSISRLLAEQIMNDLEKRIFESFGKGGQNRDRVISEPVIQKQQPLEAERGRMTAPPPANLPMIEPGEVVQDNTQKPVSNNLVNTKPIQNRESSPLPEREAQNENKIQFKTNTPPQPPPIKSVANAQTPFSVPRFNAVPVVERAPEPTPQPISPQNVMEQKLSGVSVNIPKKPEDKPVHKYTVDPYREPIE